MIGGWSGTRRNQGFTLIELLVAVAVIALLAMLIFPVAHGVMQSSRAAVCVSNLRTLGSALHAYIAENNGRFPPSRARVGADAGGNPVAQHHWIYSHYYGRSPASSAEGLRPIRYFSGPEPSEVEMGKPGKHYKDAGIFWCPADNNSELRPLKFAASSYGSNDYNIGDETAFSTDALTGASKRDPSNYTPSHSRLIAVRHPSQIIFAIDHVNPTHVMRQTPLAATTDWPFPSNSPKGPPANTPHVAFERHNGKANALFLDGSVRALTYEDLVGTKLKYLDPALQQ